MDKEMKNVGIIGSGGWASRTAARLAASLGVSTTIIPVTEIKHKDDPFEEPAPKTKQSILLEPKSEEWIEADSNKRVNQGQKKFFYGESNFVWARDQKNADRKAKNKGFVRLPF